MTARRFLAIDLIIVAVILHGSLYPYDFHVPAGGIGPVATLFAGWDVPDKSYAGIVANILLYMPFGFFLALTLRRGRIGRVLIVTLAGLALCTGVELAQYFEVDRLDSMSDVYFNTLGTGLGAASAVVLGDLGRRLPTKELVAKPVPLLLLVAMLGYHLFPYVPTIDLHKYWHALRPLIVAPHLAPYDLLHYFALWLTTSWLIGSIVGFLRARFVVPPFMAVVLAAKVAVLTLVVTPAEAVGAALALIVWFLVGRRSRFATLVTAAVLCASILIGRLQPFQFLPAARPFGWLPFRGFLDGSITVDTIALLEKFFLYGSLVWIAAEAVLPLWLATLLVASLLFGTSLAETYLPGRSAEITDTVMVVMIGLIFVPFRGQARPPADQSRPVGRRKPGARSLGRPQGT
jgi:VanZ family protein